MYRFFCIFASALFLLCFCLSSCSQPSSMPRQLSKLIGPEAISAIRDAPGFSTAMTKAKLQRSALEDIEMVGEVKKWPPKSSQRLKEFLLDDENYQFALIQKNIFISDVVIRPDQSSLAILYSRSTNQLKFLTATGSYTIDIASGKEMPLVPHQISLEGENRVKASGLSNREWPHIIIWGHSRLLNRESFHAVLPCKNYLVGYQFASN